jgi:hypothetical protein
MLLFLNHTCAIIVERGQTSFAFLILTFKITKLYFSFCWNASFEVIYFVVVLSIGFVGARLDQAWLWHKS